MGELTKKTVKNSLFGLVEYIWPMMLAFFATPFIISNLGIELYGIFALASLFIGFLGFLDLGMTAAALKDISFYFSEKRYKDINKTLGATLAAYSIIGGLGSVIVLLVTEPFIGILKISPDYVETARFAFYFMAILFPINVIIGAIAILPKAIQRYDIATKISLFVASVNTLGMVTILYFGYGLKEILILGLLLNVIAGVAYYIICRSIIYGLKLSLNYDFKFIKSMFRFGGYVSITSLSSTILFHLDKIIIGAVLGVNSVSYYTVPSNLAQKIHGGVTALTGVIFPLSSELHGKGENEKMVQMYFRSSRLIIMLVTAGVVAVSVFYQKFILYWLGPVFAEQSSLVFLILLITYYFLAYSAIPFYVVMGSGRSKVTAFFSSLNAFINIILIYVLIYRFGLVGVSFAYLFSVITVPFLIIYAERAILGLKGLEVFAKNRDTYVAAIIQGIITYLVLLPLAHNLWQTIILIITSYLSFFLLSFIFKLYNADDKKLLHIFINKIKK